MPRKKKEVLIGNGMNADLLKQFIDLSYEPKSLSSPQGFQIDAPLSDSRVKVYTKNNSKDVIVTHRGSASASDWIDNALYAVSGKVKGTATYNLHRERHKKAVEKYGASNIIAIGHSRAGLYIQELQKEFPIKENITYNKASGFHDIGRQNDANQTDVRVGNDIVSLLAPLQNSSNKIVNIKKTKNPLNFMSAHATGEINKLGSTFIGKKDEPETEAEGGAIKRKRGRPRKVGGVLSVSEEVPAGTDPLSLPTRPPPPPQPYRPLRPTPPPQQFQFPPSIRPFSLPPPVILENRIVRPIAERTPPLREVEVDLLVEDLMKIVPKKEHKYIKHSIKLIRRRLKEGIPVDEIITVYVNHNEASGSGIKPKRQNKKKVGEGLCCSRLDTLPPSQVMTNRGNVNTVNPDTIRIIQLANRGGESAQWTLPPVPPPSAPSSNRASSPKKQGAKYKVGRGYGGMISIDEDDEEEGEDEEEEGEEDLESDIDTVRDDIRYAENTIADLTTLVAEFKHNLHIKQHYLLNEPSEMAKKKHLRKKLTKEIKLLTKTIETKTDILNDWQKQLDERNTELERLINILRNKKKGGSLYTDTTPKVIHTQPTDQEINDMIQLMNPNDVARIEPIRLRNYIIQNRTIPDEDIIRIYILQSQDWYILNKVISQIDPNIVRQIKPEILKYYIKFYGIPTAQSYKRLIAQSQELGYQPIQSSGASSSSGAGFNKKQLTQIILDKNKVIEDLEETAYGGNYNTHYLDNILDSNTTSQNILIHSFKPNTKYIQSLVE